jgi:hypothetical protein
MPEPSFSLLLYPASMRLTQSHHKQLKRCENPRKSKFRNDGIPNEFVSELQFLVLLVVPVNASLIPFPTEKVGHDDVCEPIRYQNPWSRSCDFAMFAPPADRVLYHCLNFQPQQVYDCFALGALLHSFRPNLLREV